jgi:serine protease Do
MITARHARGRACARRFVLPALGASLAAAALLVGPVGSGHSLLPAVSAASAAESTAGGGWMGVQIQPVTMHIAESLGLKDSKGALVAEPLADSPAAEAGILAGDVITAMNGEAIKDARDLVKQVGGMTPGATVKLTIWRKDAEQSISLTLGEMPKARQFRVVTPQAETKGVDVPRLGLMLAPAGQVGGSGADGVVVVDIDASGLASEHGFKTGDIILDVGGKKVVTPVDVRNAMRDAQQSGKRAVLMRLKSDDVTRFVAIPIVRA